MLGTSEYAAFELAFCAVLTKALRAASVIALLKEVGCEVCTLVTGLDIGLVITDGEEITGVRPALTLLTVAFVVDFGLTNFSADVLIPLFAIILLPSY
jgi:hypothetical protein